MIESSFRPTARSTRIVTFRWGVITELNSSPVSPSVSTQSTTATPAFPQRTIAPPTSEFGIVWAYAT